MKSSERYEFTSVSTLKDPYSSNADALLCITDMYVIVQHICIQSNIIYKQYICIIERARVFTLFKT